MCRASTTRGPRLGWGVPLVGRRPEVRALSAALDRAAAGRACAVLLSGEADALVTVSVYEEHLGRSDQPRARLAEAKGLARASGNLSVELRSYYNLGISLLDAGRLAGAGAEFYAGEKRAAATGTTWSGTPGPLLRAGAYPGAGPTRGLGCSRPTAR
ncbi:hypothetical protein [Pseudonocardia acidicola]|uniref:Tetratricopeptide repeat protein n=1 Tax=Pseudonocardia acidicola TaxID=2724939 RepID=A0ABX1SJC9_9PSEU|nr:hypothetical protein [Pseudonocardia acidicola]NMI00953.1 hypothetical protein [Pseudonocardia acidicola]